MDKTNVLYNDASKTSKSNSKSCWAFFMLSLLKNETNKERETTRYRANISWQDYNLKFIDTYQVDIRSNKCSIYCIIPVLSERSPRISDPSTPSVKSSTPSNPSSSSLKAAVNWYSRSSRTSISSSTSPLWCCLLTGNNPNLRQRAFSSSFLFDEANNNKPFCLKHFRRFSATSLIWSSRTNSTFVIGSALNLLDKLPVVLGRSVCCWDIRI